MSSEKQRKTAAEPVGQQLRRARERLGLSISVIADQQHLRTSVIEAIEEGDFSKVDTELFLKGYVRAYAQHVGLNADAIIHDLDDELEPLRKERELQHDADPLVDIERRKRRKRRVARAIVVILILAAVGFAASIYLADGGYRSLPGFGNGESPETSENAPEVGADTAGPQIPDAQTDVAGPESPETGISESPDTGLPENFEVDEPETTVTDAMAGPVVVEAGDTTSQAEQNAPVEVSEVIEPETSDAAPPEPESEVVAEPATAPPAAEEVADSVAELRMSFNDDCWVQVTDSQGNRLASTLRTAGDVLELSGEAPLSIVVGAMSALDSLEFQGEPVDLNSIRAVNDRAQFTLEP